MSGARLHTLLPELTTRQSVMVVGAAVIDVIADAYALPWRGCDIELKQQSVNVGGCALNIAVALKRLGIEAGNALPLGQDVYKRQIIRSRANPTLSAIVKTNSRKSAGCLLYTSNWATVKFWQQMGLTRVILSRELSLEEIEEIRNQVPDMEIEIFVHGALCMAYSGRCLLSGYINKRDPNQGTCTNACRWEYNVQEGKEAVSYTHLFLYRHRAVYSRFTILRTFRHAERTVAGTRVTGRWRCDDGAGRQVDGDENRTARAIYGGDDLCHVTRSGRSAARSGARRSAGGIRVVALDLFDQHSGGDYWRDRHTDVNAELHHADAAL